MPRWASLVEIAGVSLTGCRVEIQNPFRFKTNFVGSTVPGNDGSGDSQIMNVGRKRIDFGLNVFSKEITVVDNVLTAIETVQVTDGLFRVKYIDEMYNLDIKCTRDYNQEEWFRQARRRMG
jgi:hypothetical protein